MSQYHVLEQSQDKKTIRVVFHFPVNQSATNAASILYTDIVKKCCDLTSILPNFETEFSTEYNQMQNGLLIERLVVIRFSSTSLTAGEKRDEIEARWEPERVSEFAALQTEWEWYGYSRDISA